MWWVREAGEKVPDADLRKAMGNSPPPPPAQRPPCATTTLYSNGAVCGTTIVSTGLSNDQPLVNCSFLLLNIVPRPPAGQSSGTFLIVAQGRGEYHVPKLSEVVSAGSDELQACFMGLGLSPIGGPRWFIIRQVVLLQISSTTPVEESFLQP